VTYNLSDFPDTVLEHYGIEAVHPDEFLSGVYANRLDVFLQTVFTGHR